MMPGPEILEAARWLRDLGFLDIQGDRPWAPGGARLIVALRDRPQLTHFDPEWVGYWHPAEGRGRLARLDRETPLPIDVPFSWGPLRIYDRLGVSNAFLAFGGRLVAEQVDETTSIAVFSSPAPIARWTGHSQAPDPLAERIGAFFGRLMVPVDFVPGFEAGIVAARPLVIYAAMIADWHDELAFSRALRENDPRAGAFVEPEVRRIQEADPEAWREGTALHAAIHATMGVTG
jgi:hypothetical protein